MPHYTAFRHLPSVQFRDGHSLHCDGELLDKVLEPQEQLFGYPTMNF